MKSIILFDVDIARMRFNSSPNHLIKEIIENLIEKYEFVVVFSLENWKGNPNRFEWWLKTYFPVLSKRCKAIRYYESYEQMNSNREGFERMIGSLKLEDPHVIRVIDEDTFQIEPAIRKSNVLKFRN